MNEIKDMIVSFVEALPPLLQLILGMAIVIGSVKFMIVIADMIEAKKGKKDS
jgi:hypothetical protein